MRRINRRKSPERVQKTRIGKHFNALLQRPSAIRRSENPVTLLDLYQLIDDNENFLHLRTFACDVIEVRITGGEVSEIQAPTKLSGIRTYAADYHYAHIQPSPRNWARDRPIRLLSNGVLEISDGPHLKSTTSFLEGIMRAEQAKHLRGHIAALVVTNDPKDEEAIVSRLFFRQRRYVSRGMWQEYWTEYKDYTKNTGLSHKDAQTLLDELSTDSCIHKFSRFATTGRKKNLEVIERCEFCGEERTRKATEREQKKYAREEKGLDQLHRLYRKISKRLEGLNGIEAIDEAEKIAERYPSCTQLVYCDDEAFATSMMLFVDHENDKSYMGTSVFYLPQCMGTRAEFFLYPGHRNSLAEALEVIRRKTEAHQKGKKS